MSNVIDDLSRHANQKIDRILDDVIALVDNDTDKARICFAAGRTALVQALVHVVGDVEDNQLGRYMTPDEVEAAVRGVMEAFVEQLAAGIKIGQRRANEEMQRMGLQ